MSTDNAIVLFAHGARDPLWAQPLLRLQEQVARVRPGVLVRIAYLEMQEPGLGEALAALVGIGVHKIDLVPIFWSRGGHVSNDLPPLVAAFCKDHPGVALRVLPALSDLPGMSEFIARTIVDLAEQGR